MASTEHGTPDGEPPLPRNPHVAPGAGSPADPKSHLHPSSARRAGRAHRVVRRVFVEEARPTPETSPAALRRRRVVVAATLLIGALLLGLSFAVEQGEALFYPLTLGLAATWVVGAFASGPLHLGHIVFRDTLRRPVLTPIAVGLGLAAVFIVGGLVIRSVPALATLTQDVLGYASDGVLAVVIAITLLNGVAEELFFRGALYAALPARRAVALSTVAYVLATLPSGNLVLVFAAAVLGVVVGFERRASGGILGPALTHVTWSLAMLLVLPAVFGA